MVRFLSKRVFVRACIGIGAAIVGGMIAWQILIRVNLPAESLWRSNGHRSLVFLDSGGRTLRTQVSREGGRQHWVALNGISPHLVRATLAAEDSNFYEHAGVDWSALFRAVWLNTKAGRMAYGGSTITMQLAGRLKRTPRTIVGKLKKMLLAARLERCLSKDEILEHYFNRIYYGNGAWGAAAAAKRYFDRSVDRLTLGQASLLAVLPRNPTIYDPFKRPGRAKRRRRHVLTLLHDHGGIDQKTLVSAASERFPRRAYRWSTETPAQHFVDYAAQKLQKNRKAFGSAIRTTLDRRLQVQVQTAVSRHTNRLKAKGMSQAGVVVLRNRDGAILAMIGSADYGNKRFGQHNVVNARLRPGSALKPFVYALALERGATPATQALDIVLAHDATRAYGINVKQHGPVRYREALAGSYNLSAVHTLQSIGVDAVVERLRLAGLSTLDRPDDSYDERLAIGHAEVTLLELTAAFAAFGNAGVPVIPRAFGESERAQPIFDARVAYQIFDILQDETARRPMFGQRVPMYLPFPVALKTGTTRAYTDNWALGTTREFTVGVWAGNFEGKPSHKVVSRRGSVPLLRASFQAIASVYGNPTTPAKPDGLVEQSVCALTGLRPGVHCPHRKIDLFRSGNLPRKVCDWHRVACGQTVVEYPPALQTWARAHGRIGEGSKCRKERATYLRITSPRNGAAYVLDSFRALRDQRPPVSAQFDGGTVRWTVDGRPWNKWIPTPGSHRLVASSGKLQDQVAFTIER